MNSRLTTIEALASRHGATQQDIDDLADRFPKWVTSINGELYPNDDAEGYIDGFLRARGQQHAEAALPRLDERLTIAYAALNNHPKMPRAAADQAVWQTTMLRLFSDVAQALTSLVDAKVRAGRMSPDRAATLRANATRLQSDAERNVLAALRQAVRVARG